MSQFPSAARLAACAALLAALASPIGADDAAPPVLDALLGDQRLTLPLAELAERVPLGRDENFRVLELGRDAHTSHHLVAIRSAELPHRHDRHDLLVVILEGHGTMQLGEEQRAVGPRSVLYVPRGTLHAFRNAAHTPHSPAVAYAVYTPPFDGEDRITPGR